MKANHCGSVPLPHEDRHVLMPSCGPNPPRTGTRCIYERVVLLSGMIAGFRDADTEKLWATGRSKRLPPRLNRQALKKLYILNAALALENLTVPPGNRLEKLRKDREGQHSIRINDQYRICFAWRGGNAHEVEVVDYH